MRKKNLIVMTSFCQIVPIRTLVLLRSLYKYKKSMLSHIDENAII